MVGAAGEALVIEMNPRLTPLCNIRLEDGRDVIGGFMRSLTGREVAARNPAAAGLIANFPIAWQWDSADERLAQCFQDIPHEHPALVEAMLQAPWPERQPLARALAAVRRGLGGNAEAGRRGGGPSMDGLRQASESAG